MEKLFVVFYDEALAAQFERYFGFCRRKCRLLPRFGSWRVSAFDAEDSGRARWDCVVGAALGLVLRRSILKAGWTLTWFEVLPNSRAHRIIRYVLHFVLVFGFYFGQFFHPTLHVPGDYRFPDLLGLALFEYF